MDGEQPVEDLRRRLPTLELELRPALERLRAAHGGSEALRSGSGEARRLRGAVRCLEQIRQGKVRDVRAADVDDLRAIVRVCRPALPIDGLELASPPHEWRVLEAYREALAAVIPRIGRIRVADGAGAVHWIGTGFLCGDGVAMTNSHVATKFAESDGRGGWRCRAGMSASLCVADGDAGALRVTEVVGVHAEHDLALVRVAGPGSERPLRIAAAAPTPFAARRVYVVGHPAADPRNPAADVAQVFASADGRKHLQPGRLCRAVGSRIEHDCSTLGGNSGSPVLDLQTHAVLGLHFAGSHAEANYALPLWTLRDDGLLRAAGIAFEGSPQAPIPDFTDMLLQAALSFAATIPFALRLLRAEGDEIGPDEVPPGPPEPRVERNALDSPPGELRDVGGTVSVILYRREPDQTSAI
jgi:hypothetical protein